MKVLNLRCAHGHVFEGWFGSEAEYKQQLERSLLECPACADRQISKMPSAPRLNITTSSKADSDKAANSVLLQAMQELVTQSDDVGADFAQEARRIHDGESPQRSIRGQATRQEAIALLEDGIPVLPLPHLPPIKGQLQ